MSDFYSPVSGEIVEVHEGLPGKLATLSDDPYGPGWIAKIRLADDAPPGDLLDYAAYQKLCDEEAV